MYKWIAEAESDGIPSYSHTTIGVGGLVVNDNSQVLVVAEKKYPFPHWKLPGGFVDPGIPFALASHILSPIDYFQMKI